VVNFVVPTGGKQLAGSPQWMNKTVISANYGPVEAQFFGDYVGSRWATYVNDAKVGSYFITSARVGVKLPAASSTRARRKSRSTSPIFST
jgi:hypothetical protein